jgi:hypothetical protein
LDFEAIAPISGTMAATLVWLELQAKKISIHKILRWIEKLAL